MPNIPHTIVKNGAHMLAKGLADMKAAGNLPLLGKCDKLHTVLDKNVCYKQGDDSIKSKFMCTSSAFNSKQKVMLTVSNILL